MKSALRILLALTVASMFIGGGLAGTAAADDTIYDNDVADINTNVQGAQVAIAVNAGNSGDDNDATAGNFNLQDAGDEFDQ